MAVNEKKLFNLLLKQYGFYIDEYEFEGKKKWIALKDTDGGLYAVITSDEEECNKCYYHAEQFLKSKNVSFSLNNVIFTKSNKQVQTDDYNKLIFNTKENSVIYCSSASDVLSRIINMMTNNEKSRLPLALNVTNILILINIIMFVLSNLYPEILSMFILEPGAVKAGEYWRLITAAFLHADIIHIFVNMYSLSIIGSQLETFLGRTKYLSIYLFSAITASTLSCVVTKGLSLGASGASFGLLGSLAYFGYHYRLYFGSVLKSQILPVIAINLIIGFTVPLIDNAAHIGGLIGGVFITMALGINDKKDKISIINGIITACIYLGFLLYLLLRK